MQVAERYLSGFRIRKSKRNKKNNGAPAFPSGFYNKVELTRSVTVYTRRITADITSMTIDAIVGKRSKGRRPGKYGR